MLKNLYLEGPVKKFADKCQDPNRDITGIDYGDRVMVTGGSGAGKTNWLMNFLINSQGSYHHVVVCNMNIDEPLYQLLNEQLKAKGQVTFFTKDDMPTFQQLYETKISPKQKYAVVFDDCVTQIKMDRKFAKLVTDYFIAGRKQGFTMFFLTQSFHEVPKVIRLQATDIVLLKLTDQNDLGIILRNFNIGIPLRDLRKVHNQCITSCPSGMGALKIKTNCTDITKKFARNFTDYFDVEQVTDEDGVERVFIFPGQWIRNNNIPINYKSFVNERTSGKRIRR